MNQLSAKFQRALEAEVKRLAGPPAERATEYGGVTHAQVAARVEWVWRELVNVIEAASHLIGTGDQKDELVFDLLDQAGDKVQQARRYTQRWR